MECDICGQPAVRCFLCVEHLNQVEKLAEAYAKRDGREVPTPGDWKGARDQIELNH